MKDFQGRKIELAPTHEITRHDAAVSHLLTLIGEFMDPEDPAGWAQTCWVSDQSSLSDFGPDEVDLALLTSRLGFAVERSEYIHEIAVRMEEKAEGEEA